MTTHFTVISLSNIYHFVSCTIFQWNLKHFNQFLFYFFKRLFNILWWCWVLLYLFSLWHKDISLYINCTIDDIILISNCPCMCTSIFILWNTLLSNLIQHALLSNFILWYEFFASVFQLVFSVRWIPNFDLSTENKTFHCP